MPTKKKPTRLAVVPTNQPLERQFGSELVRVEAAFRNPDIRKPKGGPWELEADKVAWTDPMTGYACIILRDARGMHLRGFVGVPPSHPFFGRSTGSLIGYQIGIHGGLDYARDCQRHEPEYRSICHVREIVRRPEKIYEKDAAKAHDDAWWLGFSCNQPGDVWPGAYGIVHTNEPVHGVNAATYKDEHFVYRECLRLALQLKAVEQGRHPTEADPGPATAAYDLHDHWRA
ncbi:hypothetical protein ACFSC3_07995 [Sphingomonas floccifaciens]|uniref:Uncharacterized protein n=1 Tax=Sphingomonas floccifaciens TaxID=1844115 RepID=A0ABW4NDV7_9SPHN